MMNTRNSLAERFMRYVKVYTQSDPESGSYPSTPGQLDLSNMLKNELDEMGIKEVALDEYGYLIAKIPASTEAKVPAIFFCAHVDTTPDYSGKNVKPIRIKSYKGQVLKYPDDENIELNPKDHPNLLKKIGHDLIHASGTTLLGADDKAGVAILMQLAEILSNNSSIKHGDIYLLITPDEEIGKGVLHLDISKIPAEFGFTLDGGDRGEINFENFSADSLEIKISGVSAHPGYAKGKMQNAIKIASAIIEKLPKDTLCPEVADIDDGFVHPTGIKGDLAAASVSFIIRDFETKKLDDYTDMIRNITREVIQDYPGADFELIRNEQYRNMKDVLIRKPHIQEIVEQALKRESVEPVIKKIRGGTDGAMLTYKGLPCPNIFAGQQAIHSKYEWISVQDMETSLKCIMNICELNAVEK